MVVVKWLACTPSIPMIQAQIPLIPTFISVKCVLDKIENKRRDAGVSHLKRSQSSLILLRDCESWL